MAASNKMAQATMQLLEQLLEQSDIEDALAGGLEILLKLLDSEVGAIWLRDADNDLYYPSFFTGHADLTNQHITSGQGIEGKTAADGQSRMIGNASSENESTAFDQAGVAIRNLICVPLNDLQNVIGCLIVANTRNRQSYTQEDLQLCNRMASVAAIMIAEDGYSLRRASPEKKVLIQVRDLIKDYPSGEEKTRVLNGLNLNIYEGEFVVILGESGCGKSTLVNIIGGMDHLTDGSLIIDGKDFSHPTEAELTRFRREYMGFVFQQYNLMPNLTAQENVQFIADLVKEPMTAEDAIAKVGLTERAGNFPSMLSGGQQQRVSIARAIVKNPKIIFADEPTAALDYQTSIEVLSVFEQIVRDRGSTVVMITHNPEIARMANRVVKLRNGVISSIRVNLHPAMATELVW
jgi:ABC-type lipoprotein export system ATPase subunit/putative methionine-R-sulfoxide reductase with GAF domain